MDQDLNQEQPLPSDSRADSQDSSSQADAFSNQTIDDHIKKEQDEIAELDAANEEGSDDNEASTDTESDGNEGEESTDDEEYQPNTKFKVLDEEKEFDPKLKNMLTKETEPIIRELYEKAHGIEAIKASRSQITQERDQLRGNYNNLVGEVGRILNYKKGGDLQSFFESVQLDDNTIAKYILEKARISQLPPEQQAVYNEREALRKRMNTLEQNFQNVQATGNNEAVNARLTELDSTLSNQETNRIVQAFDARNGKGAFRQAVMEYGAAKYYATKQDLSVKEAVEGFIKMTGVSAPKGQPKPGANATKRVVARPQVKTIPNYGGGQASVTATKKPKSVEDLRKLAREMANS